MWQELLGGRRTLLALVLRDLRTRNAGSAGGLAWAVLTPLFQLAILTTVFSLVLRVRFGGVASDVPFAITLAWGFFPWLGFQEGVSRAATALVDQGVLLRRMGLPPAVVLAQPVLAAQVQLLVALLLVVGAMPLFGVALEPRLLGIVLPFALGTLLSLGAAVIAGILHVYFRDTSALLGVVLQAWFYLTPIVYSLDMAPQSLRPVLLVNPVVGVVDGYRAFALGQPVPLGAMLWTAGVAGALLWAGARLLDRARPELPDLV